MYQKFEVKVKYEDVRTDGRTCMVSQNYLVEGVSFADVEETIHKHFEPYIKGEFVVDSIKRANYSEMHLASGGEFYYKVKVTFNTLDEEKGIEKKTSTYMLIAADSSKIAIDIVDDRMGDSIADYSVTAINETKIIDVFVLPETEKEGAE